MTAFDGKWRLKNPSLSASSNRFGQQRPSARVRGSRQGLVELAAFGVALRSTLFFLLPDQEGAGCRSLELGGRRLLPSPTQFDARASQKCDIEGAW